MGIRGELVLEQYRELAGHGSYFAWGFGGQCIILVPELELVGVTTSSSTVREDRRGRRHTVFGIVEQLITPRWRTPVDAR